MIVSCSAIVRFAASVSAVMQSSVSLRRSRCAAPATRAFVGSSIRKSIGETQSLGGDQPRAPAGRHRLARRRTRLALKLRLDSVCTRKRGEADHQSHPPKPICGPSRLAWRRYDHDNRITACSRVRQHRRIGQTRQTRHDSRPRLRRNWGSARTTPLRQEETTLHAALLVVGLLLDIVVRPIHCRSFRYSHAATIPVLMRIGALAIASGYEGTRPH